MHAYALFCRIASGGKRGKRDDRSLRLRGLKSGAEKSAFPPELQIKKHQYQLPQPHPSPPAPDTNTHLPSRRSHQAKFRLRATRGEPIRWAFFFVSQAYSCYRGVCASAAASTHSAPLFKGDDLLGHQSVVDKPNRVSDSLSSAGGEAELS